MATLRAMTIAAAFTALAYAGQAAEAPAAKVSVVVGIPPHRYFVERVGGEYVDVTVLMKASQSPHSFEPTPRQMTELSGADLYVSTGLPFEKRLLEKAAASAKSLKVVDAQEQITLRPVEGHEGSHEHGLMDPHVWLSPALAKVQAATIARALVEFDPAHRGDYEENLAAFTAQLELLDSEIRSTLVPFTGKSFFVFHPTFGYFADAYGLKQVSIEVEGKEPGARQLAALVEAARLSGTKTIFVQPQFSARSARAVAEAIGAKVAQLDPLAYDYIANMKHLAGEIAASLAADGGEGR